RPAEFTGWHMLAIVCLFFGTIITVNLTLAFNAATTWTGLMVANTYVESQNFNDRLDAAEAQSELGWTATLSASPAGLTVQLRDAAGQDLTDATLTAMLGRPVQENEDRMIAFAPSQNGRIWRGKLEPGLWQVQLIANADGEQWVKTVRFIVAQQETAS
ncbi:MAG: FixH family protein, partial [Pseudomonadota bacterium]